MGRISIPRADICIGEVCRQAGIRRQAKIGVSYFLENKEETADFDPVRQELLPTLPAATILATCH